MSSLEKLQKITNLQEFATLLGYDAKALSYILYKIPDNIKYTEFQIPKKNGSFRTIKSPDEKLKRLQRRLADLLNKCFEESCVLSGHKKSVSHGFRKNHSIITNAIKHKNKRYVFNVDIKNFFPTINFGRVYGFFIKNAHFKLDKKVATLIAQIACHDNELPQGSPCSPVISNFIGHLLDIRMVRLAKKNTCTYSRYADDLVFSTNNKIFPKDLAIEIEDNQWEAGNKLRKEVEKVGFIINEKKTSMQYKTSRQVVTGLVVNKKVNIKNEYYRTARSMCHELFFKDEFYIKKQPHGEIVTGTSNQLEGLLSFIYQIKRSHDERKIGPRRNDPTSICKLYREFLFYKHFVSLEKPLILCEGKTDIIYLKCALKALSARYPNIIEKINNDFVFKINFLNFSDRLKDVLSISEGTPGLRDILDLHKKIMPIFNNKNKIHPIIMMIDNDSGAKEIKKKIKDEDIEKNFSRYSENLYIALIPECENKATTAIEDLFSNETLETIVDGKKFNRESKINPATEYGKIVFAEKVIKQNQNTINFDGFHELFSLVDTIIADYAGQLE